jgi:hypothetical protein
MSLRAFNKSSCHQQQKTPIGGPSQAKMATIFLSMWRKLGGHRARSAIIRNPRVGRADQQGGYRGAARD